MSNLRDYKGRCDLCGQEADSEVAEVVGLDCSFGHSEDASLYHQACLEKYLKGLRLERNRKTGFTCPRGFSKCTAFTERCKGRISKSHPVTIRSENNKKRRQAELEQLAQVAAPPPAKAKTKKEREKEAAAAAAVAAAAAKEKKGGGKAPKTAPAAPVIKALNVTAPLTKLPPPKTAAQLKKEQEAAARDKLRAQIAAARQPGAKPAAGASSSSSASLQTSTSGGVKTLDEYLAEKSGSKGAAVTGAARASSAASSGAVSSTAASAWGAANAGAAGPSRTSSSLAATGEAADDFPPAGAPAAALRAPQGAWAASGGTPPLPVPKPAQPGASAAAALGMAAAAPSAGVSTPSEAIPGMLDPSAIDSSKPLTKAQRKNIKRAEKKAAARLEDDAASLVGSGVGSASFVPTGAPPSVVSEQEFTLAEAQAAMVAAEGDYMGADAAGDVGADTVAPLSPLSPAADLDMHSQCMRCIVQRKLSTQIAQLAAVGFPADAAAAAVGRCAGDLEAAVAALLAPDGRGVADLPPAGGAVDVSAELAAMAALAAAHNLPLDVIEAVVVDCDGDLDAAAACLGGGQEEEEPGGDEVMEPSGIFAATAGGAGAFEAHGSHEAGMFEYAQQQQQSYQQGMVPLGEASGGVGGGGGGRGGGFFTDYSSQGGGGVDWSRGSGAQTSASSEFGWNSLFGASGLAEAAAAAVAGTPGDGTSAAPEPLVPPGPHQSILQQLTAPRDLGTAPASSLFDGVMSGGGLGAFASGGLGGAYGNGSFGGGGGGSGFMAGPPGFSGGSANQQPGAVGDAAFNSGGLGASPWPDQQQQQQGQQPWNPLGGGPFGGPSAPPPHLRSSLDGGAFPRGASLGPQAGALQGQPGAPTGQYRMEENESDLHELMATLMCH